MRLLEFVVPFLLLLGSSDLSGSTEGTANVVTKSLVSMAHSFWPPDAQNHTQGQFKDQFPFMTKLPKDYDLLTRDERSIGMPTIEQIAERILLLQHKLELKIHGK